MKFKHVTLLISLLLGVLGVLTSFWPLEVVAILFSAYTRHPIFAVLLGVLLDIAYGAPTGILQFILFPFTILGALSAFGVRFAKQFLLQKHPTKI